MEYYQYTGNSFTTNEKIERSRWDPFPSLFLQYKVNQQDVLTFSAARRITRPDFRQLNPFTAVSNPYYIEQGNPYLLPFFSNSTELKYLLKSKYSFTVGYAQTSGAINTVYKHEGVVVISTSENVNDNHNVFLLINAPAQITSWWQMKGVYVVGHDIGSMVAMLTPGFFRILRVA